METKALCTTVDPDYDNSPHDTSNFPVPPNWLETISLTDEYGRAIEYVSQQRFRQLPIRETGNDPIYFTREHYLFRLWPNIPDGEKVVLLYYAEPDAGSTSNEEPETYHLIGESLFYGAVAEGWRFVRDMDKHNFYRQLFADLLEQHQLKAKTADYSGSTLIAQNPYF